MELTRSVRALSASFVLLAFAGCASPEDSETKDAIQGSVTSNADSGSTFAHAAEEEAWLVANAAGARTCSSNSECVREQVTCCPCSSSGMELAVSAETVPQIREALKACPEQVHCLLSVNCNRGTPACVNGECRFQ